jgi:hypothetical protein
LGSGECFGHGGAQQPAFDSVAVLEQSHGPSELAQRQEFDFIGQRN